MPPKQKPYNLPEFIIVITIIISVGTLSGAVYYLANNDRLEINKINNTDKLADDRPDKLEENNIKNEIDTSDWKMYTNKKYGFEFEYDNRIIILEKNDGITLSHSIPFKHLNPCDFGQGGASPILKDIVDFEADIKVIDKSLIDSVITTHTGDYITKSISDNKLITDPGIIEEVSMGSLNGYVVYGTFEGCGSDNYYFPLSDAKTLYIQRSSVPELLLSPETYSNLPNIITIENSDAMFEQIVATFKLIEKSESEKWKIHKNEKYGLEFEYPSNLIIEESHPGVDWALDIYFKSEDFSGYILIDNPGVGTGFWDEVSVEYIKIDGKDIKITTLDSTLEDDNQMAVQTDFNLDNNQYFILFRYNEKDNGEKSQLAKKILSTLKFKK